SPSKESFWREYRFSNAEMLQSSQSQSLVCIAKRTRAAQSSYQANYQSYQSNALEDNSQNQPGMKESINSRETYKGRILSVTNVFRKNCFGQTLLHMAAKEGNTHMVRQILKVGAEVNIADNAGWTPLHEAVVHGFCEVSVDLIKTGALVNATAHNGVTPLHDAIRHGHMMIAEVLLKHGADPLLKDVDGKTAFSITTEPFLQKLMEENIPINKREELLGLNISQCFNACIGLLTLETTCLQ
uniref:Uncharacterized protein n=1 Tax=Myripristis murdjan TaxID=586833 RepID=A0A667Y1U0_9TELE